jgi:hypothetical protein
MKPQGRRSKNLIMFSSHDLLRVFLLSPAVVEFQSVDRRFHVRPLLSALTREQRFHLLGLSLQGIRLLHCTQYCAEEERMPLTVPRNMREWMHIRQPDHVVQSRSAAGRGVGSMKGVSFGTNTDHERKGEYVGHFFKEVDEGVNTMLRNDTAKLVLARGKKKSQSIVKSPSIHECYSKRCTAHLMAWRNGNYISGPWTC